MVNQRHIFSLKYICLPLFVGLLLFSGCSSLATKNKFYSPITQELRQNNFDKVVEKIEQARRENKWAGKDRFLYYLDAGLAHHFAGNYDSSNLRLAEAERSADELFTKSISKAAASILLNDNVLEYAGEDYEILYTNLIMAMNYLAMGKFDDAFVEVRRVNEKLELLDRKYADAAQRYQSHSKDDTTGVEIQYEAKKVRFNNDAFARYLSMHIYAADGQYDDARIDYNWLLRAFTEQPHIYDFTVPEVTYYSKDKAILSIVAMTGAAPLKVAFNLRIRTDKDLNLVQVLSTDINGVESNYGQIPIPVSADYYFKFSIPKLKTKPSEVNEIRVYANNRPIGSLQLIEKISNVAAETFEAKKSLIYLRSIGRAVFKGLTAHNMKKKADTGGLGGWLKKAAIDVGMDLIENADLRSSHLLPGQIYVGDFEIEPGTYNLVIDFLDVEGRLLYQKKIRECSVKKNYFNLSEAIFLN